VLPFREPNHADFGPQIAVNPSMPAPFVTNTICSVLFSAVGFLAFSYGKRMHNWAPMICGLSLMLVPLFLTDLALWIVSLLLSTTAVVFRHS